MIDDKCLDDFVQAVYDQRVGDGAGIDALKLVYTPLNGTGLECVNKLLQKLGVTHVTVVPEQEKPDGDFPTCPYPNPEIREAMQKGLELCDKVKPDLLLGTDPDCDRCGTAVPDGKGGYRLITGNEMGIILLDYICRTRLAQGTMPADPVAVTTIVSTDMATPVAKKYGVELRRTLTGFKFIGEQIGKLEAEGRADRYIFGFEESYGYLSGAHVRDKDAVNATLLVCEAAAWYAQQGKTLLDAIEALYKEFGYYRNALCSFAFEGETGMHTMQNLMKNLRANPPAEIAGLQGGKRRGLRYRRHRAAPRQCAGIPPGGRPQADGPPLRHRAEDQSLSVRRGRERGGRRCCERRTGRSRCGNDESVKVWQF